jgi:hypothetical protein
VFYAFSLSTIDENTSKNKNPDFPDEFYFFRKKIFISKKYIKSKK